MERGPRDADEQGCSIILQEEKALRHLEIVIENTDTLRSYSMLRIHIHDYATHEEIAYFDVTAEFIKSIIASSIERVGTE